MIITNNKRTHTERNADNLLSVLHDNFIIKRSKSRIISKV